MTDPDLYPLRDFVFTCRDGFGVAKARTERQARGLVRDLGPCSLMAAATGEEVHRVLCEPDALLRALEGEN
ncbi:hypothetical protein ELZ19_07000 [Brucella abortus]|uniref:hypothetical protein n=1 Tax=Brucella abortus TaxID=235 RepID=UPI0004E8CB90|nr:hypothetical protein [Brucella abortus]KFH18449.1 hypothetical protein IB60_17240 [Brucella abortus LMN1]RUQ67318.1 hypothetical protein ELZ23_15430 [Brucella abortus]RUQ78551.1 hypothetical protein ELZ22_16895 [Brucella abortus]RUQ88293.1 hypothetical protein ELZ18_15650 [Brucella abortus]RUQ90323.1 hypothetical protein ELZ20_15650 [Brucella abortus]